MHVKMLEKREIKMASGAKNIKHAGWEGEVPDEIGEDWVNEGAAEFIGGSADGVAFTPDEKLALKHVAGQVLQNAAQEQITLDDLDLAGLMEVAQANNIKTPAGIQEDDLRAVIITHLEAMEAGEVDDQVEEVEEETPVEDAEAPLELDDLTYDELVDLAEKAGIDKPRSMKKAALVAVLAEKAQNSEDAV